MIEGGHLRDLQKIYDQCVRDAAPYRFLLFNTLRAPVEDYETRHFLVGIFQSTVWTREEYELLAAARAHLGLHDHPPNLQSAEHRRPKAITPAQSTCRIVLAGEDGSGKSTFWRRLRGNRWALLGRHIRAPFRGGSGPLPSVTVTFAVDRPGSPEPGPGARGIIAFTACDTSDPHETPRRLSLLRARVGALPVVRVCSKCDLLERVPDGRYRHLSTRDSPVDELLGVVSEILEAVGGVSTTDITVLK